MLFYTPKQTSISSFSKYYVYAHACGSEVYVGFAADPVKRWSEHYNGAYDKNSREYNSLFRAAIRKTSTSDIKHYLIASTKTEEEARDIEASAIEFYSTLNVRPEFVSKSFDFKPLSSFTQIKTLETKKNDHTEWFSGRSDKDRHWVTGKIIIERSSKRVISLANDKFPAGLKIECSRSERSKFNSGDLVKVKVALSEKHGKQYLVAAKTATLQPA